MMQLHWTTVAALVLVACLLAAPARSEPYLAVGHGYQCGACHVNPTGGGLRNAFGIVFAENVMPARGLPSGVPVWSGSIADVVRIGGNFRFRGSWTEIPHEVRQHEWNVDQLRLYGDLQVIEERLGIYVDESLAPGSAQSLESYLRYTDASRGLYLKAGRFYLPFGWRLQDNTAFVRQVTGISMTTPDDGIEAGFERGDFSASLDLTNGAANTGSGSGYQLGGQLVYARPMGRVGGAVSFTNSDAGNRVAAGLFAGVHTGPLVWLGEIDLIRDNGFAGGERSLVAGFAEVNWGFRRGHNLKLTVDYFDPDRDVRDDERARYSLLYEYTPLPFAQLRVGVRRYDGIPQIDFDNRSLAFLEVHGFF